jgi:hypothetical protein
MARGGSLVYYAMQVNNVFAYFLTRNRNDQTSPIPDQFPTGKRDRTGKTDLDHIVEFAKRRYGKDLDHANVLAMEVKSAWIEAAGLADPDKYITITASVPVYKKSSATTWEREPNKTEEVRLAMVGMHVVGSVAGHPEMIWATFEHVNNAPSGRYTYWDTKSGPKAPPKVVDRSTGGTWLFFGSGGTENRSRMGVQGGNIVAVGSQTIGPVDVVRLNAWGVATDGTDANDRKAADANTDVISINNSVIGHLKDGDVRKNYIMTGSTWLKPGGIEVGTTKTANTTMETFQQPSNCFGCHGNRLNAIDLSVSQIYHRLKPLPDP